MSTDTTKHPVMTLEETERKLRAWLPELYSAASGKSMWGRVYFEALRKHISSALHHLEEGKRDSQIVEFLNSKEVRVQWVDNALQADSGDFREVILEVMDPTGGPI